MVNAKKTAVIISISSDIGTALCNRWLDKGWDVHGTYRTNSDMVGILRRRGAQLVRCDLSLTSSVLQACSKLRKMCPVWDVLILAPGTQAPIGNFFETDFPSWEASVEVNFIRQLMVVHHLFSKRRKTVPHGPCVIFFAGGGTNTATLKYSAYTISKISLIKMCELLDAEVQDTRFTIVGPGWVKTKIHNATLKAGKKAGFNYDKTIQQLASSSECTPMDRILDCCDWIIRMPRSVVGGRNFSVVFDRWGDQILEKTLTKNPDLFKLRRYGNSLSELSR